MKKIIIALCLFSLVTVFGYCASQEHEEDYSSYPKSNTAAAIFMSRAANLGGYHPQKKVLYGLGLCVVFQKTLNGYLLVNEDPAPDGDIYDPLFLETSEELREGQNLFSRYAYYTGDFEYTSMSGFNKRIYAFKLVRNEEIKNNSRLEHSKPVLTDEEREKEAEEAREKEYESLRKPY